MTLRPTDQAALDKLGLAYEEEADGAFTTVTITGFPLPDGLQPAVSDLLIRLPPGFPDAAPDMFWLNPAVSTSGGAVPGTESREVYLGRTWQRWSRHIGSQWRPGIDDLATYIAYIRRCFADATGRAA